MRLRRSLAPRRARSMTTHKTILLFFVRTPARVVVMQKKWRRRMSSIAHTMCRNVVVVGEKVWVVERTALRMGCRNGDDVVVKATALTVSVAWVNGGEVRGSGTAGAEGDLMNDRVLYFTGIHIAKLTYVHACHNICLK